MVAIIFYRKVAKTLYQKRELLKDVEYSLLVEDIPIDYLRSYTSERDLVNDFYGIASILKKYADIDGEYAIKGHIEHGLHFGKEITSVEYVNPYNSLVLMGPARLDFLKNLKRKKYVIGPYIYYANATQSVDKIEAERRKNGKTLLVFPAHSVSLLNMKYDILGFCQTIEDTKEKYHFKKVTVCLYWRDFNKDNIKFYEDYGFECVTAGHYLDPHFLNRLRTIIELSDVTISNKMGTHIGYSLILNRPHFLSVQKIELQGSSKIQEKVKVELYGKQEIENTFNVYVEVISDKQREVGNYYFGLDSILSKNKLKEIIMVMK